MLRKLRIQQEGDDEAYRDYCRQRYNEEVMRDLHREQDNNHSSVSIEVIVKMIA